MTLAASLKPLDTSGFERALLTSLAKRINYVFEAATPKIRERLETLIEDAIENSPEAHDLHGGRLQGELGVVNPNRAIVDSIHAIVKGMAIEIIPVVVDGSHLRGGLRIGILRTRLEELQQAMDDASFISEGGYKIDWLRWLLTEGDNIVIGDFRFVSGNNGRTGLGLMYRRGQWRVPPQFAGTITDNWFSRALNLIEGPLTKLIHEELGRVKV